MYDLMILGAGPAGLTASIYASRYKIKHLVVGSVFDGSAFKAHFVENWPGENSIKGSDLVMKFYEHAKSFGTEIAQENVMSVKKTANSKCSYFTVETDSGKTYEGMSILVAIGMKRKEINIPGEKDFLGKGVSYCAVCDGGFFKEKTVAVVGGNNSAVMAATMLSEHAKKVYIIYRRDLLRCEPIMLDRINKNKKIEIIYNTNVKKIIGNKKVEAVNLDKSYCDSNELKIDGLFIEIGSSPLTDLVKNIGVDTDENGNIIVNSGGATNIGGIYAAGDITNGSNGFRQIVTAVSEGAIVATSIYKYLKGK